MSSMRTISTKPHGRATARARWAAIGAAVAVTFGGGGLGLAHASISSGAKPVFVAVAPCRVLDTRPDTHVGPRTSPLGPGEIVTQQITGTNGNCTGIPTDTTAVAMNVTIVAPTADSYLTFFPADLTTPPDASNLNWTTNQAPTPNKVDVKLSPTGAVKILNKYGTVHVIADIVGYYQDHNHDDRYYTKTQIDAGRVVTQTFNPFAMYFPGATGSSIYNGSVRPCRRGAPSASSGSISRPERGSNR